MTHHQSCVELSGNSVGRNDPGVIIVAEEVRTMSFDLPDGLARDLERYAQTKHISTGEALTEFVRSGLATERRKGETGDSPVEAFFDAFPGFRAFDDVTDEQWDQVLKKTKLMSKEGLSVRG